MAKTILYEPSRTLMEFRLLPRLTTPDSTLDRIDLRTPIAVLPGDRHSLHINLPVLASAMQSVSGPEMGIELALLGGLAFIYCSQSPSSQAAMVARVKNHKAGFVSPRTVPPSLPISQLDEIRVKAGFSTFPVVDDEGVLLGLITRNDYDLESHKGETVFGRMVPADRIHVGVNITDLKQANSLIVQSHHSVLPIVDEARRLQSLVFRKDIEGHLHNPLQATDRDKRLLAAAAINTHDYLERVPALVAAGIDVLAVDSSDGHSFYQQQTLKWLAKHYPDLPVIGGNIITAEGFDFLAAAGAHAVKVGMGGGSICITQEQKGTGRGLATSIIEVSRARDRHFEQTGRYLPIIADGGIGTAKDLTIALAMGADAAMMGRYFARMEESPTEKMMVDGRVMKPYWGEGSARAREWKAARYHQATFVEGVEGLVDYAGKLRDNLEETVVKIKASMSSCGCANLDEFHRDAVLEAVSALSIREGKVHGIHMPGDGQYQSRTWGGCSTGS